MNGSRISSRLFILGILLGVTGGIIVGSILGMQLGEKSVTYVRGNLGRLTKQKRSPRFDLLLQ